MKFPNTPYMKLRQNPEQTAGDASFCFFFSTAHIKLFKNFVKSGHSEIITNTMCEQC